MTDLTHDRLFNLNELGIIPGPSENKEDFFKRAEYCLGLKHQVTSQLPFDLEDLDTTPYLEQPCKKTIQLFDIAPIWIPIVFSNYQLAPWHGGCAWIFQINDEDSTGAFFQLRQSFKKTKTYLGIYSRDELIAHEISHVGRMVFQEPKFEEMIAYQTSPSLFRRWFGPIVQSSIESMLFVIVLFLIAVLDTSLLWMNHFVLFKTAMWIKLLPILMLLFAVCRLFLRHWQFSRALSNLKHLLGSEEKAKHVLYRLQDHEIKSFSSLSVENIQEYAYENSEKSLRWKLIYSVYFSSQ